MDIERLQIEGGFLDGLDVKFSSGLNVLIGARGTGKTSVIELIRFVLAAQNHTSDAAKRSIEHATAVIDDGQVTVQLNDLIDNVTVSRTVDQQSPQANGDYDKPLIFSQTEIESLGLSASGRLHLIDSFLARLNNITTDEIAAISGIRSIIKEIATIEDERRSLASGLEALPDLENRIKSLESEEEKHRAASTEVAEKQARLASATSLATKLVLREEILDRFTSSAHKWSSDLNMMLFDDFGPEEWQSSDAPDPLLALREQYYHLISEVNILSNKFNNLGTQAANTKQKLTSSRLSIESKSRTLRSEVEQSVAGAGTVSRRLSQLKTEMAQLLARKKIVEDRDQRIFQLRSKRNERIKALDAIRLQRYEHRMNVANVLNKALGPEVKVQIQRYGQYADYNKALTDALRGSGMRYTDLVFSVCQSVSPHELIHFIDNNDFITLADIAGIQKDRAARLLGHLRESGIGDLATVSIEDNVRLSLLDGVDYKDVEHLSAGQRCTVVLSIVLQHHGRTLIIDQPEDHLDNAYIATTIIKAIRNRKSRSQLIISTHNANIPVLGDADLVIEMTSDGRNGFVQVCDKLSSVAAVNAITNLMEGGRKAFSDRAKFYNEHVS